MYEFHFCEGSMMQKVYSSFFTLNEPVTSVKTSCTLDEIMAQICCTSRGRCVAQTCYDTFFVYSILMVMNLHGTS